MVCLQSTPNRLGASSAKLREVPPHAVIDARALERTLVDGPAG